MLRAKRTATLVLDELEAAPELVDEPRLRERCFGVWEGLQWSTIEAEHAESLKRAQSEPDYAIPGGGESRQETLERALGFLSSLPERHTASDDNVLLVTHSGTATSLIREVLGLRPDGPRRFEVRNLALNELKFDREKGVWLLRTLGDVAHLQGVK